MHHFLENKLVDLKIIVQYVLLLYTSKSFFFILDLFMTRLSHFYSFVSVNGLEID